MSSEDREADLREAGALGRYRMFRAERGAEIAARAAPLGATADEAAAVLFSLSERLREREEMFAPEEILVGLGVTPVEGGGGANLHVLNQVDDRLRVVRLEVPPEVAAHFVLRDLKIGKNTQFASGGGVPMSAFAADARRFLRVEAQDWLPGTFLIVMVEETSGIPRDFTGAVVCHRRHGWQGMGGPRA